MSFHALRSAAGAAALTLALAGWTPAIAQDDAAASSEEPAEDRVVAEVNGEPIYESEVMAAMGNLPPQLRQMPPQMVVPMLADQLATGLLIAEQGYAEGLEDSEEVQERLADAERRIVQDVWLSREIEERVTDEAVEEAYQQYLEENPPAEEVHARHILVETKEEAEALIQQLEEGADFATLANENSTDGNGTSGGDLGYFSQEQMVEPFGVAAFAMEPGTVSEEPVETQFGWHVIKVEDKRLSEQPSLEEVRPQVEGDLTQATIREIVDELRADAEIVLFGPDGEPLPAEGEEEAPAEAEEEAPAE